MSLSDLPPETYTVVGGDVDRVTVSVRIGGDTLDPDEVTRTLGVEPTFAARKGERRLSGGREVVQRTGVWYAQFGGVPEEWTLAEAIEVLLKRMTSDLSAWHRLAARYQLDVLCGLQMAAFNRGLELPPRVLAQLAERHLTLGLDIYYVGARE